MYGDFLESNLEYDAFILYSDDSGYSIRNVTLENAFTKFAKEQGKTVTQKILERDHTQMEVDSVNAKTEGKLLPGSKRKPINIYAPAIYVTAIQRGRTYTQPYEVKYLDHTFFKDYSKVGHRKLIRTGYRVGVDTVNELRAIQYKPDGKRKFKLAHTDDWEEMPEPRRSCNVPQAATPATIPLLFKESRPIVQCKYRHLQDLKAVLPADHHAFVIYDLLRH